MSRQKTLNVAIDQSTKELVGYWTPQSGVGAIVVRAENRKLLERKFQRALRAFEKRANSFSDRSRSPKKYPKKAANKKKKVKS